VDGGNRREEGLLEMEDQRNDRRETKCWKREEKKGGRVPARANFFLKLP
jgi:hypothetical protein